MATSAKRFQCVCVDGRLLPLDEHGRETLRKLGDGEICMVDFTRMRNPQFHRKFMALVRIAFDLWNPDAKVIGGYPVQKSFENFRKELTIQAGYYDAVFDLEGNVRFEAKSIAWGTMGEEYFSELYEAAVHVLSLGIMPGLTVDEAHRISDAVINEGF